MPLTRFKLSAIEDGGIATADLADGAVTTAKLADSAVTSVKTSNLFTNTEIAGTEAAKMPVGTTAERANEQAGDIRFNSTLSLMEYYDGTIWKAIDAPPVVSSISPTTESDGSANITITGSNFQSGATVQFIGNDGTVYNSPSVTVNSSTEVVATTPSTPLSVENEPYDVKLTNTSGLAGTLGDALDAGGVPSWSTAAGTILTIYDSARSSPSVTVSATDPDGDTVSYAIASGDSLPSGLSLNSSTGAITGSTSAVGSDTTTTFDLEASTTSGDTVSRTFNIIQKAPVVTSYTSTGAFTFSVPSGVTAVDVLAVAGGGGGGSPYNNAYNGSGGGGAGGLIFRPQFPVTPGGSVPGSIGAGGLSCNGPSGGDHARPGTPTTFGGLTAIGGGGGGGSDGASLPAPADIEGSYRAGLEGAPGGSGGGSKNTSTTPGSGIQPQQPGDSGTYGFGNPGGSVTVSAYGSGGGGAGAAGSNSDTTPYPQAPGRGGPGGIGKQYDISGSQVYYAGGGGGGSLNALNGISSGGQGGGGAGNDGINHPSASPAPLGATPAQGGTPAYATINRGGGGGAGGSYSSGNNQNYAGPGAPGIVIVKY